MPSLAEKYAPRSFGEVLGQSKLIRQLDRMSTSTGFGGRAYWLSGSSGTGKTSVAKLIARTVADGLHTYEFIGRKLDTETLDMIERRSQLACGWAWIVNEAHTVSKATLERLLGLVDTGNIPSNVVWVFTTTKDGEGRLFDDYDDSGPLLSRCIELTFTTQGLASVFAKRAQEIARAESLDGQEMPAYLRLAKELRNNFRAMLSAIEAGAMLQT